MYETSYTVTGMSCDHCVRAVTAEVGGLPGVTAVEVDLGSGNARVASEAPLDDDAVRAAVEKAGYDLAS